MKATVNPVDQHVVTLTIEVPAAEVDKGIKQAVKRIAGQVNIPGFRKGHAPRRILEMNFGKEAIMEEAFEVLASQNYTAALRENDIVPVSDPEIEREQFEEGKDLIFKATVREQQAKMVVAEEGATIQKDDFAVIDFAGSVDGKPFDGGEGKSYPLQIGSGNFIPGFEDQLIGAKAGDDVTVKVTFPEDYFVAELAGKEAEFKTKRKELPELNDEFAKEASSYETIEELKKDLRAKMEEEASRRAIDTYNADLIQTAVKNATVEIPEVMIEDRVEQMIQELAMNMEGRGLKLDDYLKFSNKTIEDLRSEYKDSAAENVRADLVLDAIATAEGIEVTPDDIFIMAQNFGADPKEVWDIIAKEGRVAMLAGSVARKKAARFIIDNAKGAEAAE